MNEKKQSFDFTVGKSDSLVLMSGTKQIWQFTPDKNANVVVNILVTEIFPDNK
jgi:hypothetical protein